MSFHSTETIAAIATPPGQGGVGIVRISGSKAADIARALLKRELPPREALYTPFFDIEGETLDQGIALWFPAPNSFTGEDVLELQGHGGPVILNHLLQQTFHSGARHARPGEFSERAFLNGKLDLTQAEAIADLIEASSLQAAKSALHSLEGKFATEIRHLCESLVALRVYVEAAIDFPEEEIDFLADGLVVERLDNIIDKLSHIQNQAQQGSLLREGIHVIIIGRPNAGKSSLLNALTGRDSAIVTPIEGTTRDILREQIVIDGLPIHIIDTAGLRQSSDTVEIIGIERARKEFERADHVLLLVDSATNPNPDPEQEFAEFGLTIPDQRDWTLVLNKADLSHLPIGPQPHISAATTLALSVATESGLKDLKEHLKDIAGYQNTGEDGFIARQRHLDALSRASELLLIGRAQLLGSGAGELLAEDLRQAHQVLGEITGEFSSDDLLGEIFSNFCIGK